MKSLGAILALALAGLQLLAVAVVVFSSYFTSERSLLEHARSQLYDVGTNVIQHTKWFMSPARSAAELSTALATNQIVRREDRDHLEGLLFQQLRSAPQFAGAYYGDSDGNFVYVKREGDQQYLTKIVDVESAHRALFIRRSDDFADIGRYVDPTDTYDPRARPWYIEATAYRSSIWTDPYIFFTSQSPGITAATPVVGFKGNVQGVVGVDIEIAELSNFLSNLRIGKTGAALILNRNGDVIAHPNPDLLTTKGEGGTLQFPSITEIDDPIARAAFGDRLGPDGVAVDSPIQSDFELLGERFVSLIMPFGLDDIPWTIVLYAPQVDFTGALKENRAQNTLIAIAVAATTALLGLALANRIHAPVRAFAVRSSLISQGEVDPNEPLPSTYKELENANTALVHEISERRRTETEYREIFERASRGMVRIDNSSGRLKRVNESFAQLLGYSPGDLEGVDFRMLLDPEETEIRAEFSDWIGGQKAFGFEAKVLHRGGETVWISFNGIYVHEGGPDDTYVVATIDDITQARATEETIETLNREIAYFSRQEMMGELATGLAHELNQPLTAITQNVDAAQLTIEKTPNRMNDVRALLGEIDDHAHQAADIIRALRALVRKDENVPSDFGIIELVTQARRLVLPEARQHSVDFVLPKGEEIMVRAVKVQVAQVVVNLLRNAVESLALLDSDARILRVSATREGDHVRVVVEDNGPGIDDALELFTPFETTKRDGMGLGLSISRTLIEANGGKIWHERSGQMTRFCFTLPVRGIGDV
ncbi:cache domain-containing protein [Dinoroseobacter sp. PD6]|uniref:cache domain-containing protein n=1 Tax=Dinoroseobacter sp. PD6 TaxID=3028384 RepID=UPI00237BDEA3|nr:cache domain-containing protein [Dinoroseobacter sp. PD6]MDD9717736.1 cache domain-containing protein [Dinoroseobacter sp. PD6]